MFLCFHFRLGFIRVYLFVFANYLDWDLAILLGMIYVGSFIFFNSWWPSLRVLIIVIINNAGLSSVNSTYIGIMRASHIDLLRIPHCHWSFNTTIHPRSLDLFLECFNLAHHLVLLHDSGHLCFDSLLLKCLYLALHVRASRIQLQVLVVQILPLLLCRSESLLQLIALQRLLLQLLKEWLTFLLLSSKTSLLYLVVLEDLIEGLIGRLDHVFFVADDVL